MGDAHHRDLLHRGMLDHHRLDVGGVDVVPTADDHVLLAADDVEEAVLVDVAEISAAQPSVGGPGRGGGLRVLVVLTLATRHSGQQLAHLARPELFVVVIHDPELHAADGFAHRADAAAQLFLRHHDVGGSGFGHAVGVRYRRFGEPRLERGQGLGREGSAADRDRHQARQVRLVEARVGHDELGHRGNEKRPRRALGADDLEPAVDVELGLIETDQSELHRVVDERDAREGEHGGAVEPSAAGPVGLDVSDHGDVGMTYRNALGQAGRARGVHDVREVLDSDRYLDLIVGFGVDLRERRAQHGRQRWHRGGDGVRTCRQLVGGEHRGDLGVTEDGHQLGNRQASVRRYGHRRGLVHCGVGHHPVENVGATQEDRHPIPGRDAPSPQAAGELVRSPIPLAERERGSGVEISVGHRLAVGGGHETELVDLELTPIRHLDSPSCAAPGNIVVRGHYS